MQVGDAAIGIDHCQPRASVEASVDGRHHLVALREPRRRSEEVAEAVIGADVGTGKQVAELVEQVGEEARTT